MDNTKTSLKGKNWLKKVLLPYRASIVFLAVLSVIATLCSLCFALCVRYLINSATNKDKQQLLVFALIVLFVLALKIVLKAVVSYLSERERAKMDKSLRKRIFSSIIRSDYGSVQSYHSGELNNRLTTDISEVCVTSVGLMQSVASMFVQCLGAIIALMTIDPYFTLIYIVGGLVIFGVSSLLRKVIKKNQKEFLIAEDKFRSFMQEGLSSVLTIKAYSAENKVDNKAEYFLSQSYIKRMSRNKLRTFTGVLFNIISNVGMIFAVIWCSVSVFTGNDDYGAILSIMLLLMQLQQPFSSFSGIMPVIYSRLTSCDRLAEIEDMEKEQPYNDDTVVDYDNLECINVDNVTYSYGREDIFNSASCQMEKGSIICITGQSGSGKSTLFRLLLNVYFPQSGKLTLKYNNGENIPLTNAQRKLFAYVPQGNFLFAGTIKENILFFSDENESKENLDMAIKVACAEFIYDLPKGLETPLGEGGDGLSEGQLQRIAVARAIISRRPILLLDEATSALDGETEEKMLKNIGNMKDRTCIIVTHRPAALKIAKKILNVNKGKINEINIDEL